MNNKSTHTRTVNRGQSGSIFISRRVNRFVALALAATSSAFLLTLCRESVAQSVRLPVADTSSARIRADALLKQMSAEQKIGQLSQEFVLGSSTSIEKKVQAGELGVCAVPYRSGADQSLPTYGRGRVASPHPASVRPRCHSWLPDHLPCAYCACGLLGSGARRDRAGRCSRRSERCGYQLDLRPDGGHRARPEVGQDCRGGRARTRIWDRRWPTRR